MTKFKVSGGVVTIRCGDLLRLLLQDAVDLSKAGLKVDAAEVAEKTGYSLRKADQSSPKASSYAKATADKTA